MQEPITSHNPTQRIGTRDDDLFSRNVLGLPPGLSFGGPARNVTLLKFVLEIRHRGIRDQTLLKALESIPRELFLPRAFTSFAYEDRILPIASGQIMTSPFQSAHILQALDVGIKHRVLEIGAGTGFETALLARLARRVIAVERSSALLRWADTRIQQIGAVNASLYHADGFEGFIAQAPYDRILVSASATEVPEVLLEQLAIGGKMIIPLGPERGLQRWTALYKTQSGIARQPLTPTRIPAMRHGLLRRL
jgi:protein-L-isoaspartate(D-aspartate) O-methyltransferase